MNSNPVNAFFDAQRSQIEQSRVGFMSVLMNMPVAPKKYNVRDSRVRSG